MSKKMLNTLQNETNYTLTENLGLARATTGSELLNFFSVAGALRTRDEKDIERLFDKAFCEDPQYALKAAFYFRDIRGGQGERRTFRAILKYLAGSTETRHWLAANLHLVPEYGRWDDMFVLFGTPVEAAVLDTIRKQINSDYKDKNPSLLAKWLPSENASSVENKKLAYKIMNHMLMSPRSYRKFLSTTRAKIDVLERKLSANKWDEVDYEHVPSQANLLYRKAFARHDQTRYLKFLEEVKSGEKKIHSSVLYPYDIVRKVMYDHDERADTLDALWNNLPDYLEGTQENAIVVADVSDSMYGLPICISVSLAIYAAERNKGVFNNKFITFSHRPKLQTVQGSTIEKKVHNLARADWDMNTDVEAVFDLILNTAIKNKISQDEMIQKIYIISDMEFDSCASTDKTVFEHIAAKYKNAGYEMPFLVFWQVDSRNDQFPMKMDDRGFLNVSGSSPSIFTGLLRSEVKTAYDFMIETLDSKRYEQVSYVIK